MKKQNALLQRMIEKQASTHMAHVEKPRYTHAGLEKYFRNRHFNAAQLKKDVLREQHRLRESREEESFADTDLAESESLVQLSEGSQDMVTATAMPIYNQRAEQARVESENLVQRALADARAAEQQRS
jgi:hypothetical protein